MNAALPPPTWTTGTTEVFKTGTWRAALPAHIHAPSPCHQACPVGGEIAEWIGLARTGDLRGAWEVLTRHNPFPAIAGRVCHHPCERVCNRAEFDEAVAICGLERFVGDAALAGGWTFEAPQFERAGHIAVIGAGPAGLSAAYQLRRRGWRVTVHEASEAPGGLMRHGIPAYRLARDVLEGEIARIAALGVEIRCGEALDSPRALAELRARHDAVFLATGAARVKRLPGLDATLPGVMDGAAYLADSNAGRTPPLGHRVAVIGGGSAAIDAARSARRAGHAVTLLALEARKQMPAQAEEIAEALEEGIDIVNGAMLRSAQEGATGLRLHCDGVRFTPGPKPGVFALEPIDGMSFELHADAVLVSIGQDPALEVFGDALPRSEELLAADAQQATGGDGVWAGGDLTSRARFVTEAIAMGERAALAIHRRLLAGGEAGDDEEGHTAGRHEAAGDAPEGDAVPLRAIATWYHANAPRERAALRPAHERRHSHDEVQLALSAAQALAEAGRCFSCGSCIHCDNCVVVCPDMAVVRRTAGNGAAAGYDVLGDYCKGCGLCVRECPTGSMTMVEEAR
jgi:NADPH-dependent glutamate synthase beta subunit-like oxidoreductase